MPFCIPCDLISLSASLIQINTFVVLSLNRKRDKGYYIRAKNSTTALATSPKFLVSFVMYGFYLL